MFQHTATRRWLPTGTKKAARPRRFNTQPPEGGCYGELITELDVLLFQHTVTRRWLQYSDCAANLWLCVSTHSHPKVAAIYRQSHRDFCYVSTHSHPKVAARVERIKQELQQVSTHSHPKVAAPSACAVRPNVPVSTHSHPKVAARAVAAWSQGDDRFNTQPPEGGCPRNT